MAVFSGLRASRVPWCPLAVWAAGRGPGASGITPAALSRPESAAGVIPGPGGFVFLDFLRVSPSRPNGQPRLEKTRKTKPPGPGITPAALSGRERAAGVIPEAGLSQPQRLSPAAATQSLLVSSGWQRRAPQAWGSSGRGLPRVP